jgi:hypothetical protein
MENLRDILSTLCREIGLQLNLDKSSLTTWGFLDQEIQYISHNLNIHIHDVGDGLKYLIFTLKSNGYYKNDWLWLQAKVAKTIHAWCNHWISRVGRLLLVRSILESIPVYWATLAWIPNKSLGKIRQISYKFIWSFS